MTARKPVRCRHGAADTWTSRSGCARRPAGNTWGRRAMRGCHVRRLSS